MHKGLLIVLEGGEGAGKTTQMKRLRAYLPEAFPQRHFVFTREPGGTLLGEAVRGLIMSDLGKEADTFALLSLFFAVRADHVAKVIRPALESGDIVICDRYLATTYAYQIKATGEERLEELFWAHSKLVPLPDAVLYFALNPHIGIGRALARIGERNHLDERPMDFHTKTGEGFEAFFSARPEIPITRIAADGTEEAVWEEVRAAVTATL